MKEGEAFEHPICKQPVQGPTKDCVRVEPVERERPSDQGDLVFVARVVRNELFGLKSNFRPLQALPLYREPRSASLP